MRLKTAHYQILAWALVILLAAASVYRASSLAISMDEAYTYLSFVAPPLKQILTTYSPNHHVLYSLLAKASVYVFGASELSLRVPALAGGLLCSIALFRLSGVLFKHGLTMLLAVSLVALNPMIFDYMSEARGYSLALAFFLLGLHLAVQVVLVDSDRRRWWLAGGGALLGLSVAASLSFGIPVLALDLMLVAAGLLCRAGRAGEFVVWLILPQIGVGTAITIGPLLHAERQAFVGGYTSLFQTLNNFSISCVLHDWDGNGVWTSQVNAWVLGWHYTLFRCIFVLVIGVAVFIIGGGVLPAAARMRRAATSYAEDPNGLWLFVCSGTLIISILLLVAAHVVAGAPYPFARIVLYWWPLWVFTTCLLIERFRSIERFRPGAWPLKSLSTALLIFCLSMALQSGLELDVEHFGWLRYSAGTKQIAEFVRRRGGADAGREVTISTSGSLYACLDFYRSIYSMSEWRLTARSDRPDASDYVVMDVFDRPKGIPAGYKVVWQDHLSKAIIAARVQPLRAKLTPAD